MKASDSRQRSFVLGLTGSIGMGKSATADLFEKHGTPVHDSDAVVHRLYEPGGGAAKVIAQTFPQWLRSDGGVDRDALRKAVLANPEALQQLESVVHPLVAEERQLFLDRHANAALVVLDVPLLFETRGEAHCDAVLVVTAPVDVQRERVLSRPSMNEAAFAAILAKQMPDIEKRKRADFVIDTSLGFDHAEAEVISLIARLTDSR